jgi:hypothetical protein
MNASRSRDPDEPKEKLRSDEPDEAWLGLRSNDPVELGWRGTKQSRQ